MFIISSITVCIYCISYNLMVLHLRTPRRLLLMLSLTILTFANLSAGVALLRPTTDDDDEENYFSFIPVLSCVLICFGYALGLGPVTWILFSELFPVSVRGAASSITSVIRSITLFLSIKLFPVMLELLGIGGSFLFSATVCFLSIIISYLSVPETKDMDSDQLENIYAKKRVSENKEILL